ncbi:hypothetical protein CkaCkLH20_11433 [Colletotrichum karsti]|uniref:Uncharacterized protein n=1 Tax=Colletotrichum karsti TaxID=1095194 RepID=A0A9P6HXT5_9PEZI|nr:uncharacterized protein CkaCkLH20_11433 [Colletotrichum karsti]KAF9871016.1 hypothetical protein CkaCkLH20_11433 [Colletotrichum karsti]
MLITATQPPPDGKDPTTSVTWASSEVTETTTSNGIILPIIRPVWVCNAIQILCHPQCLIPFFGCGGINLPGPLGFPWATPPPLPPRQKPHPYKYYIFIILYRYDDRLSEM